MTPEEKNEALKNIMRQLGNGLARKLNAKVPPGHVDYISKTDASKWCEALARELRDIINETK